MILLSLPPAQIGSDPRLEKTVDLRLKIVPVEEVVAVLAKASGVPLETSPSVRTFKATAFVDHMRVDRAMVRLADVLRLRWEKTAEGFRLVIDEEAAAREAACLRAEDTQRRKNLEEGLQSMMRASTQSYKRVQERYQEWVEKLDAGKTAGLTGADFQELSELHSVADPESWITGRILQGLGPAGIKRLLAGETFSSSTKPSPGVAPLAASVLGMHGAGSDSPETPAKRFDIALRVDRETWQLKTWANWTDAQGESDGNWANTFDVPETALPLDPASAFGKELLAWDTAKEIDLEGKSTPKSETKERPSEWWTGHWSEADELEWIHDATGVPVVALAMRIPRQRDGLRFGGTLGAYLKQWRGEQQGSFRFQDGFLMHRPGYFWERKKIEISESILRTLEHDPAPSLDDYAAFASVVTPRQARLVTDDWSHLLRVSPDTLAGGIEGLRLWSKLRAGDRAILLKGGAIPLAVLPASVRNEALGAITDPFAGGLAEDGDHAIASISAKTAGVEIEEPSHARSIDARPRTIEGSELFGTSEGPTRPGIELRILASPAGARLFQYPLKEAPKRRKG